MVGQTKFDIHIHSEFSFDSQTEPNEIIRNAKRRGLDGIVITEHNSFEVSALWDNYSDQDLIILRGVEYKTREGHILIYGMDSDEHIQEPRIPLQDLIPIAIENNWALVAPHPFKARDSSLGEALYEYHHHFNAIEVNSRCTPTENDEVISFARRYNIPLVGGSDAHFASRIARAYTIFQCEIRNMDDFVQQLKEGNLTYGTNEAGNYS